MPNPIFSSSMPLSRSNKGFQRSTLPSKYLGIPLTNNSLRKTSRAYLISSLGKSLSSYTFRSLNIAGRLILVKVVLQSIPVYLLSTLAAPKKVLRKIRNMQCTFLWKGYNNSRKWALIAWGTLYLPNKDRALGLRDPKVLSEVLGTKL